ncbi:MAG: CoA pyrophosphatase [Gemmatimonadaceae bacterium]
MTTVEALRRDSRIARLEAVLNSRIAVEVNEVSARRAAVAIIIRPASNNEPEVLFIQRADYPADPWSGHVAFPGGREEAGDDSLATTAVRETREETGIDLAAGALLLGTLNDLRPQSARLPKVVVRPFVYLASGTTEATPGEEAPVSFWVPLDVLMDRSFWRDADVMASGISMRKPGFHHGQYVVWGMTERILAEFVEVFAPAS